MLFESWKTTLYHLNTWIYQKEHISDEILHLFLLQRCLFIDNISG